MVTVMACGSDLCAHPETLNEDQDADECPAHTGFLGGEAERLDGDQDFDRLLEMLDSIPGILGADDLDLGGYNYHEVMTEGRLCPELDVIKPAQGGTGRRQYLPATLSQTQPSALVRRQRQPSGLRVGAS